MADLGHNGVNGLIRSLSELDGYDFFLFDTSAGVSKNVVSFCMASSEIILVVTPEPTSLTDAYSLLKILSLNGFTDSVMVAINQCKSLQVANTVFTKFKEAVQKYLPIKILPLGTILTDSNVEEAVKEQRPFISLFPESNASKCIKNIGRHLIGKDISNTDDYGIDSFWNRYMEFFKMPLQLTALKNRDKDGASERRPAENKVSLVEGSDRAGFDSQDQERTEGLPSKAGARVEEETDECQPSQDTSILLHSLVEGIASISKELGEIRRVIEGNRGVQIK